MISKSALPDREELWRLGKCLSGVFFLRLCLKRRDALQNILEIKIELGELNIPGAGSHGAGP
jgi:hypothetical protein